MRLFGGDRISGLMTRFNMPEDVPLTHPLVSRAIENAQVKVEGFNFDIRKHLVEYDDVLNKQREIVYQLRRKVVLATDKKGSLREEVLERIDSTLQTLVTMASATETFEESENVNEKIITEYSTIVPFDQASQEQLVKQLRQYHTQEEKIEFLTKIAHDLYEKREEQMGKELMRKIERFVMLSVIDKLWMDHLDAIDNLRGGIGLRGYAQKDPLVEYKNEAYRMFEQLMWGIDDEVVHRIFKIQVQQAPTQSTIPHQHMRTNTPKSEVSENVRNNTQTVSQPHLHVHSHQPEETTQTQSVPSVSSSDSTKKKVGRNDPCWCGSGKKYKKCHYPD